MHGKTFSRVHCTHCTFCFLINCTERSGKCVSVTKSHLFHSENSKFMGCGYCLIHFIPKKGTIDMRCSLRTKDVGRLRERLNDKGQKRKSKLKENLGVIISHGCWRLIAGKFLFAAENYHAFRKLCNFCGTVGSADKNMKGSYALVCTHDGINEHVNVFII